MTDGIGKRLAAELKQRADARVQLEQAADKKNTEQKAADEAALTSLASRVREEVESFNEHAGDLPSLTLTRPNDLGAFELRSLKHLHFSIQASKLQITILPAHSPVFSTVRREANGYTYRHIGPNGTATNRESSENEMVDSLLRQACGL